LGLEHCSEQQQQEQPDLQILFPLQNLCLPQLQNQSLQVLRNPLRLQIQLLRLNQSQLCQKFQNLQKLVVLFLQLIQSLQKPELQMWWQWRLQSLQRPGLKLLQEHQSQSQYWPCWQLELRILQKLEQT